MKIEQKVRKTSSSTYARLSLGLTRWINPQDYGKNALRTLLKPNLIYMLCVEKKWTKTFQW